MTSVTVSRAFGMTVRSFREKAGLSQEQFAEKAGLDRTYVSGVERGVRNPTLEVIHRIACALEVPMDELFKSVTHKKPERKSGDAV
jgi:transcriptional regulator with XRE-family HTH domain